MAELDAVPPDFFWLTHVAALAEGAAGVGDPAAAARLHELLAPYATRFVQVGHAAPFGPVAPLLEALDAVVRGPGGTGRGGARACVISRSNDQPRLLHHPPRGDVVGQRERHDLVEPEPPRLHDATAAAVARPRPCAVADDRPGELDRRSPATWVELRPARPAKASSSSTTHAPQPWSSQCLRSRTSSAGGSASVNGRSGFGRSQAATRGSKSRRR